jgi:hypothetical protein
MLVIEIALGIILAVVLLMLGAFVLAGIVRIVNTWTPLVLAKKAS